MLGYARIWWDMVGYGGMCWDVMGCGGTWWDMGGGSARGEKPLHMLCKGFVFVPHGFYICLESFLN